MSESLETTKDIDAVDENGSTALHRAARKGDVSKVERLVAAGANVDARTARARDSTPLMLATLFKHFDVLRLLLDRGADIDTCDAHGYDTKIFSLLFQYVAQVDAVVVRRA